MRFSFRTSIIVICIAALGTLVWYCNAPNAFPSGTLVTVESGDSLTQVAERLKEQGVIRSRTIFRAAVIALGEEHNVVAGVYSLREKASVFEVAKRLTEGDFRITTLRLTIPEGLDSKAITERVTQLLPNVNADAFYNEARLKEGYLFPETYFFFETATTNEVLERMQEAFSERMTELEIPTDEPIMIAGEERSFEDVVIMASILEGEADTLESRELVAGILWKRLDNDMPLQVDATFKYIIGKGTAELTADDLLIESPYNTYASKGLPPTPINNPGEEAIIAAMNPTDSPYVYFLTGQDGEMYYAKTFEEHKRNRELYLD